MFEPPMAPSELPIGRKAMWNDTQPAFDGVVHRIT